MLHCENLEELIRQVASDFGLDLVGFEEFLDDNVILLMDLGIILTKNPLLLVAITHYEVMEEEELQPAEFENVEPKIELLGRRALDVIEEPLDQIVVTLLLLIQLWVLTLRCHHNILGI